QIQYRGRFSWPLAVDCWPGRRTANGERQTEGAFMKRLVLLALLAVSAHAARIQPSDLYKQVNVNDPQISPDGKSVLLIVSRVKLKENRWDPELMLIDAGSGAQRALTYERRGVASPRWSPDGSTIAFLANTTNERDAKRQIWSVSMRGGDPRRLTDAKQGVQ